MDVMDYLDLQGRRGIRGNLVYKVKLDYKVQEGNKVLLAFRDFPDHLVEEQSIQDGVGQSVQSLVGQNWSIKD